MFKKAKLYSLLAIIVASTMVGLFGAAQTASAQSWGGDDNNTIDYDNKIFEPYPTPTAADNRFGSSNIPDGSAVYGVHETTASDPATDPEWTPGSAANNITLAHIIFFPEGAESVTTATEASYALFNYDTDTGYTNPRDHKSITIEAKGAPGGYEEGGEGEGEEAEAKTPSGCQIKGIGWLICPVVNFLAEVTDETYGILDKTFLRLQPIALPGGNDADRMQLYTSWKMMRDFANVMFIIAFLVIVFSQITSVGVSNYGIKQLLPKIIIAAILVNVSYFICAIAVDISNIVGSQLRDLISPDGGAKLAFDFKYEGDDFLATGFTGAASIVLGAVVSAAAVYIFLPAFLPIALAAALAAATAVIVLTLRQALIVILIVVSPLAFAALLLPNTEGYFQKWKSLFIAMLLVYPIISVVFGASALASNILMKTNDFPTQMVGAGVSIIPLFLTPIIMKASGGLLNRWMGLVNDPSKGPIDGLKRNVEGKAGRIDNRRKTTALRGGGKRFLGGRYQRSAKSAAVDASLESRARSAGSSYVSDQALNNDAFTNELAGGMNVPIVGGKDMPMPFDAVAGKTIPDNVPLVGGKTIPTTIPQTMIAASPEDITSAQASAVAAKAAETEKSVKEQETLIREEHPRDLDAINKVLVSAIRDGQKEGALAAQNVLLSSGDGGIQEWRKAMGTVQSDPGGLMSGETVAAMRESLVQNHTDMKNIANDIAEFGKGSKDTKNPTTGETTVAPPQDYTKDPASWSLPDKQFASQKTSSQLNAIASRGVSPDQANRVLRSPEFSGDLAPNVRSGLEYVRSGAARPPIPPPRTTP